MALFKFGLVGAHLLVPLFFQLDKYSYYQCHCSLLDHDHVIYRLNVSSEDLFFLTKQHVSLLVADKNEDFLMLCKC